MHVKYSWQNLKQKEPLRDQGSNVKIILEVIRLLSVCVVWLQPAQDRIQWYNFLKTALNCYLLKRW